MIEALAEQNNIDKVCIIRDFNTIIRENERVGRSSFYDRRDMDNFNNMTEGSDLTEIPLVGRSYKWYRPDGSCKSKLDRLLVNSNWLTMLPNVILKDGKRSFSNHIPIFIEGYIKYWGPKLFKFFNQWLQHPTFKKMMDEAWKESSRRGGQALLEQGKFRRLESRIEEKKEELEKLDIIDGMLGLSEEESVRRQEDQMDRGRRLKPRTYSKGWSSDQNILSQMYLENTHDFGHSKERPPTMTTNGTISEHSSQSVPLHQVSKRSQNYQTRFVMPSRNPGTTTPT
ncbi:hypothetical protein ACS0TY_007949 [Phlomoides rotata]